MVNQIFGALTIVFCTAVYILSYFTQKKQNYTLAVLLLMAGGFTLRIFASADFFLHPWDEVYHAVVAKHMMHHPLMPTLYESPLLPYDYRNWTANHIWVHKQPLPLWAMAASMYLFGVNEIALRLPSVILTTIGIWLTWYLGSYLFNKKVGYLAAFFYSINGLIIEMAAGRAPTDHIDVFFLFFVELAIFLTIVFCQKKSFIFNLLVGVSIGAAILSKWLPALIVLPIWLLIVIDSGHFSIRAIVLHFIVLLAVTASVFLPWQIYIHHAFPIEAAWVSTYNYKHIVEVLDHQGGPIYYYVDRIRVNYGELIYLPLIWFVYKVIKKNPNLRLFAAFIWFAIPILFFSLINTKMQGYILFASPPLFMVSGAFFYWLVDYRNTLEPDKAWVKWPVNVLLLLFFALPVRYCLERIKPLKADRSPHWVLELKNLPQKKNDKAVLFNYSKPIDAMFYTDLTAYSEIPDKTVILDLIKSGYTVILNDNGKTNTSIVSIEQVMKVHLSEPPN